jgi:hypothetical protein
VNIQLLGVNGKMLMSLLIKLTYTNKSPFVFIIGYGAITYHFGNGNPYKKDDAQQQST